MTQPIRLLLTISDLAGGGAEREFSTLINHLSRDRFDSQLCFYRPQIKYECPTDMPIHLVEKSKPWHVFRAVRQLTTLIDRIKPELIFSQMHYVNMLTGTALARTTHQPRWICRQCNDPRREMKGPFASWARWALRRADRVLGCSEGVSLAMIEHLKLDPARVETMINAVDIGRIDRLSAEPLTEPRSADVFTVVHAGRLGKQKNQALLLEAFARFRNQPAQLWMLGEGELRGQLQTLARKLGIANQIRWLGFQENPYPFFKAADCFALTSNHEGLPNVIIESMICGTPVVSTRCPYGPDELMEDKITGLLTPVGDAAAFADALEKLANDREMSVRIAEQARAAAVGRFDTKIICSAYENLFEQVVNEAADH